MQATNVCVPSVQTHLVHGLEGTTPQDLRHHKTKIAFSAPKYGHTSPKPKMRNPVACKPITCASLPPHTAREKTRRGQDQ